MYFAGIFTEKIRSSDSFHGKNAVQRLFESGPGSGAVHGDVLESVGNPGVHDAGSPELFPHFRRDLAAGDAVFDPVFANPRVGTGKGQVGCGFRVSEVGRIEIESRLLFSCPVDPALEVGGGDFVACDSSSGIQIDGMEIQSFCAGDQGECLGQIGAELLDVPGAAGIIPCGENPAGSAAGIRFKSGDIVSLPAMEGNRNFRQCLQCRVGIDAQFRILCFCGEITLFHCFCCHDDLPNLKLNLNLRAKLRNQKK